MPRKKTLDERLDELARMVKRGFDHVPNRADHEELRASLEGKLRVIAATVERVDASTLTRR